MAESEGNTSANASGERSVAIAGSIIDSTINTGNVINNPLPLPTLTSTPNNLPIVGTENFVGRTETLKRLQEALQGNTRVAITAIAGMGGVGKTELAIQYAQKYRDSYPAGLGWFFVRSSDVGVQILKFASSFGLVPPDNLGLEERVRFIWQHWPPRPVAMLGASEPGDVLLVFDDVPNDGYQAIEPYLPFGYPRFKVLLTSRVKLGGAITTIPLDVLEPPDALTLINSLTGQGRCLKEPEVAEQLCSRLGYLPLGIELVGRYLASKPDLSLAEMLQRLEQKGLTAKALEKVQIGMTAQLGVRAAFELSWQELDEWGKEVACLLSLFAAAPIPWSLVEKYRLDWDAEELEDVRDDQLCKLNLLEHSSKGLYRLHPLIREYFGEKILEFDGRERAERAHGLTLVLEAQDFPHMPTRQQWETFGPMVPHLMEVADRLLNQIEDDDLIWVFLAIARYYSGQGIYAQAEMWHRLCLQECRQRLGEEHPYTLASIGNLANTFYDQGDLEEAYYLEKQVLELCRRELGEDHPNSLALMNNLGQTLKALGDPESARSLHEQELEICSRKYGEEDQYTLTSMNNLAQALLALEDFAGARRLFEQVLERSRSVLGEEHLSTLTSMNNLAQVLKAQKDLEKARCLEEQVLTVIRRVLGEEHPNTIASMNNLAQTLKAQGDLVGARGLFEQALESCSRVLGGEHSDTLALIHNLAQTLYAESQYEQAELLYVKAVKGSMNVGQEYPTTTTFIENYLGFLDDIVQNHPDVLAKLLSSGSEMTKKYLRQM